MSLGLSFWEDILTKVVMSMPTTKVCDVYKELDKMVTYADTDMSVWSEVRMNNNFFNFHKKFWLEYEIYEDLIEWCLAVLFFINFGRLMSSFMSS